MVIQTNVKTIPRTVKEFDEIYRNDSNPWFQDGSGKYNDYNNISRSKLANIVGKMVGEVTEVGCGLGYAMDFMITGRQSRFKGVDCSPVAISCAKKLFPELSFRVADITKEIVEDDIIILNEILWYILHDIDSAIDNCYCKYLVINNGFLKKQKYDRDIIDGWSGLLKYLLNSGFTILHAEYDSDGDPLMNGIVVCTRQK